MSAKGVFITLEGGEGVGKSTQIAQLTELLERNGYEVCRLREPGGTQVGEKIRSVLLDKAQDDMDPLTELMLFEAARAQIVREVIEPALEAGKVVLCDRFIDSTSAYQGYGRQLGAEVTSQLNALAVGDCMPDRTILLQLDTEQGLQRAKDVTGTEGGDRMESAGLDFHQRVAQGFAAIAAVDPQRVRCVQVVDGIQATFDLVFAQLADLFPNIKVGEE